MTCLTLFKTVFSFYVEQERYNLRSILSASSGGTVTDTVARETPRSKARGAHIRQTKELLDLSFHWPDGLRAQWHRENAQQLRHLGWLSQGEKRDKETSHLHPTWPEPRGEALSWVQQLSDSLTEWSCPFLARPGEVVSRFSAKWLRQRDIQTELKKRKEAQFATVGCKPIMIKKYLR